jgi:hypothetical protein
MSLQVPARRGNHVPDRMCGVMVMRGIRLLRVALLLILVLAAPCAVAAPAPTPAGWAVLMENNSFHGRYPDLPVGYINSTRMLTALMRHGWPADHILLLRDVRSPKALSDAVGWLASRAQPGDLAVFYVAGEYQFVESDLGWDTTVPKVWASIPTSNRVLIVETCYAERLTDAIRSRSGMGLPAVGRDELDWWGLRERDGLIRGGTFTFFLTRALAAQPDGASLDLSTAFAEAVAGAQEYFRTVIAATPGALDAFHARGSFPERLTTFPNPRLAHGPDDPASPAAIVPP